MRTWHLMGLLELLACGLCLARAPTNVVLAHLTCAREQKEHLGWEGMLLSCAGGRLPLLLVA